LDFLAVPRINYIVVCYLGERRLESGLTPSILIRKHLETLRDFNAPVDKVSIVINADSPEQVVEAASVIEEYQPYYTKSKIYSRRNVGHSYGGWADTIDHCIWSGEHYDYFFLIEDDYIPARPDFLKVFTSSMDEGVGYICQKVEDREARGKRHAGMSAGLLPWEPARQAYSKNGSAFRVIPSINYFEAEKNQIGFLDNITDLQYRIVDVSDKCSTIYVEKDPDGFKRYIEYGNPDLPATLAPLT
jgi:hypothetical protein